MKKNKKIYKLVVVTFLLLFVTGCDEQTFDFATMCVRCGDTYFPKALADLSRNLINYIQILVPVIIILIGMIELVRAIMAGDEKKMDEVKPSLVKKVIAGVMIFLVIAIVKFAFGLIPEETNEVFDCVSIFLVESKNENYCPSRTNGDEYSTEEDGGGSVIPGMSDDDIRNTKNCADRDPNSDECKAGENCDIRYYGSQKSCVYIDPTPSGCPSIGSERECWSAGCRWSNNACQANSSTATSSATGTNASQTAAKKCWTNGSDYRWQVSAPGNEWGVNSSKTTESACVSGGSTAHESSSNNVHGGAGRSF